MPNGSRPAGVDVNRAMSFQRWSWSSGISRTGSVPPFWNLGSFSELNESQIGIFIWKEDFPCEQFWPAPLLRFS
jgi:hypothetical protein